MNCARGMAIVNLLVQVTWGYVSVIGIGATFRNVCYNCGDQQIVFEVSRTATCQLMHETATTLSPLRVCVLIAGLGPTEKCQFEEDAIKCVAQEPTISSFD